MTEIVLEFLCAREVSPVSFIQLAVRNDIRRITVCIKPFKSLGQDGVPFGDLVDWDVIADTPNRRELRRRLEGDGVILESADVIFMAPDFDLEAERPMIEAAGWLGAESVMLVPLDKDLSRLTDNLAGFCQVAADHGVNVVHEFSPRMAMTNLRDSISFQRSQGLSNLKVSIDALHFFRGDNDIADLAGVRSEELARLQLCDGPLAPPPQGGGYEAFYERMIPGEGTFALKELVAATDPSVKIGLEVPLWAMQQAGVQPAERVERIVRESRALIDAARHLDEVRS